MLNSGGIKIAGRGSISYAWCALTQGTRFTCKHIFHRGKNYPLVKFKTSRDEIYANDATIFQNFAPQFYFRNIPRVDFPDIFLARKRTITLKINGRN